MWAESLFKWAESLLEWAESLWAESLEVRIVMYSLRHPQGCSGQNRLITIPKAQHQTLQAKIPYFESSKSRRNVNFFVSVLLHC